MAGLQLDENQSAYQIRSYQPGSIQVNEKSFTTSLILLPDQLENWAPQSVTDLSAESLAMIVTLKPDILLIGTGEAHVLLSPTIYGELINQGIGVEVMSTGAACRTFNALSSEGRRVAAALLIK